MFVSRLRIGVGITVAGILLTACGSTVASQQTTSSSAPATESDADTMKVCRVYENEMTASGLRHALSLPLSAGETTNERVWNAEQRWTPVDQRDALPAVATQIYGLNAVVAIDLKYPSQPPTIGSLNLFVKAIEEECTAAGYTFTL